MGKPTTVGIPGLTFQGNTFEFNPRNGFSLGYAYKGPFLQAAQRAFQLQTARIPYSFRQEGPFATVTLLGNTAIEQGGATTPTETPVDNWQLLGGELQKDLYEHPNSLAMEAATPGTLGLIRKYVTLLNEGNSPATLASNPLFTPAFLAIVNAQKLIALESKGGTHYAVASPVLRHTQTVTDSYVPPTTGASPLSFATAEHIYTTAQLLVECEGFSYPLPRLYIIAINSIPSPAAFGYTWGWRKVPPSLNTVANYKIEITTEYVSDLWNTDFVYALAGS